MNALASKSERENIQNENRNEDEKQNSEQINRKQANCLALENEMLKREKKHRLTVE